jgi:hypothetical protein
MQKTMVTIGLVVLAGAIAASAEIVDLTGHWTGTAQQAGKKPSTAALTADLTSTAARITGTFSADSQGTIQCAVHGVEKASGKVKIRLSACSDGSTILLRGKLTGQTIAGHYVRIHKGKAKGGKFTLSRGSSPSGAFLDDPAGP